MAGRHWENRLEDEVCAQLSAHGWLYAEGDAEDYSRELALIASDVDAWFEATQPKMWAVAKSKHGLSAILERLRKQLDQRGVLDVLRAGMEVVGLRAPLRLAQFKPAMRMNAEIIESYEANRLRVVRQVRYSTQHQNCIDLVLFLNGIPVATLELKTDFTQSVQHAVDQYRFDRNPGEGGKRREPLLSFPGGALVHFAVSDSEVMMTTRLAGAKTRFLPFNQGREGGSGNPPNPAGHATSYLWEKVLERESFLEILGRYMIPQRDHKKQLTGVIFPRFHQLDATRKLRQAVLVEGPGQKYLIQHSAGSGKTNSIAWSAHLLADLHDDNDEKIFSTVVVVSDRNVIDAQLQEAIFSFERTHGVVETITSESGSKSGQLAMALATGKKIVVCTIQTFPFALKYVEEEAATTGKRFAVIADEAHSSQTGEAAAKLKQVLSAAELESLDDGGEVSAEDLLAVQMAGRAGHPGVSFVAFTATPKAKTLELFGRLPDPGAPAGPSNLPAPFHTYSMRQAIEEGFILDVLQNYTPYKLAYRLANEGGELDDREVEKNAAKKALVQFVKLHPYNIAQKVGIVVEHYRHIVRPLLGGQAKAMVVVSSRKEAVRWQLAMRKYIDEHRYDLGTLVAFSGEVNDDESSDQPLTEFSKALNPRLQGDIREAFKGEEYHILLVANKFQTGFDQPLLCGMYIDKRLAGVQAVQTLSRLNRAWSSGDLKKDTTYILDFANSQEDILSAFRTYYETAALEDVTDPNQILDLRAQLDGLGYYDDFEVERVVQVHLDPRSRHGELSAAIHPVAERLMRQYQQAQKDLEYAESIQDERRVSAAQDTLGALRNFKDTMAAYRRLYAFLSQMLNFEATELEKRHIFYNYLIRLLNFESPREKVDLGAVHLTHHKLHSQGQTRLQVGKDEEKLKPASAVGTASLQEKERILLSVILQRMNELFEGDLSDNDQLSYARTLHGTILDNAMLVQQAKNNTKEQFAASPKLLEAIQHSIMDSLETHEEMSKQALQSAVIQAGLLKLMLEDFGLWENLRNQ